MTLNSSIRYHQGQLYIDNILAEDIVTHVGSPTYVYSLKRITENYHQIVDAFATVKPHIHYSAKANANLQVMKSLIQAGAGIDCVSGGEIYKALKAGANPADIVFAGVGKTVEEIQFALENGVGWFNVENIAELDIINQASQSLGRKAVQIALRLNPQVTANTHPYIATGHGGAKFGLTAQAIDHILKTASEWDNLNISGLHIHIGSQLGDTSATQNAIQTARDLIEPYPNINTLNIGGGIPVPYDDSASLPTIAEFAQSIMPLLDGYTIILEPGRSIVADAGILLTNVIYLKQQAGQQMVIVDASMTELIRPMLYKAPHQIIPTSESQKPLQEIQIVGPVCETTDVLARDVPFPPVQVGDTLAILTTGAYGAVMASNYNARPKPPEIVVSVDGQNWHIARKRQSWADLIRDELE